jgi:hypothetical protein
MESAGFVSEKIVKLETSGRGGRVGPEYSEAALCK